MAVLLVVEDDVVTNEAICKYMESAGHTAFLVSDGEQGLAMAKSNPVDLVILDIMLPKNLWNTSNRNSLTHSGYHAQHRPV